MFAQRVTDAVSGLLARKVDRRGLLARTAVVGSAVATGGLDYILKPGTAYASVCGSGASCGTGWTAMCCTINHGVNVCPPGSFAGGWWKADGASLCGGHARYYIDCQGECTHCGCGGGAFCSQHCWNCKPHCADGSCDKRRVCHNVFRYGQCERDRHCSGPVLCRMITCTPPWQFMDCSSASATDNYTRSHSAACLSGWTHIAKRYKEIGSQGSPLGGEVHAEFAAGHVKIQRYQHGRMYYTHHTGAHYVLSELLAVYRSLGGIESPLGLPTGDTHRLDDGGRISSFENGGVYQRSGHDAHALWGGIFDAWREQGGHGGGLGYPTTSVRTVGRGRYAMFQHGGIYNGPRSPQVTLLDPVDALYQRLSGPTGVLGWPVAATATLPGAAGTTTRFEHGEVIASDALGQFAVVGRFDLAYVRLGRTSGALGFPTAAQAAVTAADGSSGIKQRFEHGTITRLSSASTAFGVWGPIFDAWQGDGGGLAGPLGFPLTDVVTESDSTQRCAFEHGTITYDPSTGTTTITPGP